VPANQDISTIDILERAFTVDSDGDRTIGVLTKPDLVNPGGEDEVLAVARNIRKPLKLGYVVVKNRSQHQLNQRLDLNAAHREELAFFQNHPQFSTLPANQIGIGALASRLTHILVSRIQSSLPQMKHDLREKVRILCGGGSGEIIPINMLPHLCLDVAGESSYGALSIW